MSASDVVFRMLRPGAHGWEEGTITLAEVRAMAGPEPDPEPWTTAQLAVSGAPVGSVRDVLRVAALLRCTETRRPVGAVLHLDRSSRGRAPLWLAELDQWDPHGFLEPRTLSEVSRRGRTTRGDRLDTLDAVVMPNAPRITMTTEVATSCRPPRCLQHRRPSVADLIDAGRRGLGRRRSDDTPRHFLPVESEHR